MLHHLGSERLANDSKDALVTRRADGTLVVAVWNMADPPGAHQPGGPGAEKRMQLSFEHVAENAPAEHHAPRSHARQHARRVSQDGQPALSHRSTGTGAE